MSWYQVVLDPKKLSSLLWQGHPQTSPTKGRAVWWDRRCVDQAGPWRKGCTNAFLCLSRRQQRLPSGNKPQQHADHQQGGTKHNRDHQKLYQGGQAPHSSGRTGHHGYSQNRRWHHNQKHSPNDKETHRNAKETENLKIEDASVCTVHIPVETHRGPEAVEKPSQQFVQESETKRKDSVHERIGERPKINLLQSSKDRLRRRLKEKVLILRETLSFPFSKSLAVGHSPYKGWGGLKGHFHECTQLILISHCQHFSWSLFMLLQEAFYWHDAKALSLNSWLRLLPAWVLQEGPGAPSLTASCSAELTRVAKRSEKGDLSLCNHRAKSQASAFECWIAGVSYLKVDID